MDRFIAIVYRGGDLSTISSGPASIGSNNQNEEMNAIEQDDALFISEALNQKIDPFVIEHQFGAGTKPLAYIKVNAPDRKDIASEIAVDEFLMRHGAAQSKKGTMERYGRQAPAEGEEVLEAPAPEMTAGLPPGKGGNKPTFGANESLTRGNSQHRSLILNARQRIAEAEATAMAPFYDRLDGIMELMDMGDGKAVAMAFKKLKDDLPMLQKEIAKNPLGARAFEAMLSPAFLNGLTEAAVSRN
jgi:hypothetical protein